jgi:LAS superfamily LD-carboxypeptidase LdcB
MSISSDFLTGKNTEQLEYFQGDKILIHKDMRADLSSMFEHAQRDGLNLALTSCFRSYELQKSIWNEKVQGLRPVLDSTSQPVDLSTKSNEEILFLILRWSAIPGGSRHHWGSDFDIYDLSIMPKNYKVQLIPAEYEKGGVFYNANLWLNENMKEFGFFRPYFKDSGGIAPEPWHLSYKPLSEKFLESFTFEVFQNHLASADFLLIKEAQAFADILYDRYIQIPRQFDT